MPYGYIGKVLRVDLTNKTVTIEQPDDTIYRRYLGGGALASYYLLRELPPGTDPMGPDNLLVFATGPVSGSPVAGTSRFTIAAKSPLTGGYGEAEAGGFWGPELKFAGFDAVVISGRCSHPAYLWVHDGKAEIRDASALWGKTTREVEELVRSELGDSRIRVAQTGPAGENLVRYACVLNECKHANGRTGMGAVMGSKNLRAIAVRGEHKPEFRDDAGLLAIAKWFAGNWRSNPADNALHTHGSSVGLKSLDLCGMLPTRNFMDGTFEGADRISGEAMTEQILIGRGGCYACPVRCKRVVKAAEPYEVDPYYGGPEYETMGAFGSLCGVADLVAVAKANELCNKYGMDTISTGVTIAFSMECYEKGVLTKADTDGLDLCFGNAHAMVSAVELIARREGIGDLLAEGVMRASRALGQGSEGWALHVKGQELALHEPRGKHGVGLSYALASTGPDHMEAAHDPVLAQRTPPLARAAPLGILDPVPAMDLSSRKVRQFLYLQQLWSMYNSLCICVYTAAPTWALPLNKIVDLVRAATGWDTSLWELMKVGERANTMSRVFNIREGFGRKDDTLPQRLFEPLRTGALKGASMDREAFELALSTYYRMAGWDVENGRPTREKLDELDIGWACELMEHE